MKKYHIKCPHCGTLNHNLYLEETDGWMECECCGILAHIKMKHRSEGNARNICRMPLL